MAHCLASLLLSVTDRSNTCAEKGGAKGTRTPIRLPFGDLRRRGCRVQRPDPDTIEALRDDGAHRSERWAGRGPRRVCRRQKMPAARVRPAGIYCRPCLLLP
jgi:hypothetical protein